MRLSICASTKSRKAIENGCTSDTASLPSVCQDKGMMVCVRVRPLSQKEIDAGHKNCCQVINNAIVAIRKEGSGGYLKSEQTMINDYAFDVAFDETSTQHEVYQATAKKYIPNLLAGLNVTVFCYGATGAGKTHTMLGNTRSDEAASHAEAGIIPNAVSDLFNQIEEKRRINASSGSPSHMEEWSVIVSFIEVYNEQVYDLLESTGKILSLREDSDKGVVIVAGVTEQVVDSYESVIELLSQGNRNRKTEATMANAVSSRSHAILQLSLRHKRRTEGGRETVTESKLSLIDLAGSERASATNNRGARLQEGANINKSLLALANCINALSSNSTGGGRQGNVKYRDSKLTHLLKSSLEGNCNLVMIANINPSHSTYEDSHNTLKYANRAKNLKVNPMLKESVKEGTWMEREARLREENEYLRQRVFDLERIISEMQGTGAEPCLMSLLDGTYQGGEPIVTQQPTFKARPNRRDTLVHSDKENVGVRRNYSPVRRVIVENEPVDVEDIDLIDVKPMKLSPIPMAKPRVVANNLTLESRFKGPDDDHDDDLSGGGGTGRPFSGHHAPQRGNPTRAGTARPATTTSSTTSSSSSSSQNHRKRGCLDATDSENSSSDDVSLPMDSSENSQVVVSSKKQKPDAESEVLEESNVSLATMDCMFDVLSDSILEAGLFNCEDVLTPIKASSGRTPRKQVASTKTKAKKMAKTPQAEEATHIEPAASTEPMLESLPSSSTASSDIQLANAINRKRRHSYIPTVRSRKTVFIPDDSSFTTDSSTTVPAVAVAAPVDPVETAAVERRASLRKSIYIVDGGDLQENRNPQIIAPDMGDVVAKKQVATGRRKSLVSISAMLNSIPLDHHVTDVPGSKPKLAWSTASSPSEEPVLDLKSIASRTSARRKSLALLPSGTAF